VAPHGIRGEVKCRVVTDFPKQRFKRGNTVLVDGVEATIQQARLQGQFVLLKLQEITDRTTAETLRGKDVLINQADAVRLPRGQFYWHQVIGMSVVDTTTDTILGTITDILETGANHVYVVKPSDGGREILVPAIKDVVRSIDPEHQRMEITPLPGMITA